MNKIIIEHLFEFWIEIGLNGGFLKIGISFNGTVPSENGWPSKIFNVNPEIITIKDLQQNLKTKVLICLGNHSYLNRSLNL